MNKEDIPAIEATVTITVTEYRTMIERYTLAECELEHFRDKYYSLKAKEIKSDNP